MPGSGLQAATIAGLDREVTPPHTAGVEIGVCAGTGAVVPVREKFTLGDGRPLRRDLSVIEQFPVPDLEPIMFHA